MDDFKKLTEQLMKIYINAESVSDLGIENYFDENVSLIGTGKHELFRNLHEFMESFKFDVKRRDKIRLEIGNLYQEEERLDDDHVLAHGTVDFTGLFKDGSICFKMETRFTIIYRWTNGKWMVQHLHQSTPDLEQMDGEEFPVTLGKQVQRTRQAFYALGTAYYLILRLDLKTKRVEFVKNTRKMNIDMKDNNTEWNPQIEIIKNVIAEPFAQKYMEFFDIQTMAARLHNKESMSSEFKLKDGSWFLSIVVPENYDKNGNVISVLIANRDVTDEKLRELRQEEELREAKLKAECANEAKSSFLFNMSHDIRTPMNAILGYAQLMENEINKKDMPETSEHLEKLQQSGNLLLSIINNVLDMARIESGRMELDENYCQIEDVRKSLFTVFDEKARKKNIALQYTMNVEHEHVLTDVTKVKEIFVNILSNAIKYTPPGGSVMMSIDELPCDEPGYMIVRNRVSDTGIGMSQDYLTKIFDAFTREQNTTKSKIAGTGLGMSIVKKYVELLGGTIDVASEPGNGSIFTVTLKHKIADESYYVKNRAESSGSSIEILEGRNILLAEDNDLNAEIAETIFERAGLKTERVEDGIQCVNRIEKMPAGTYDMILMDIQMPKMDGYKATQAIRNLPDKDKACIPIVAMTANAFEEDKKEAIAAGMNGHIAKPIQVDKLLSILSEVIRQQKNC